MLNPPEDDAAYLRKLGVLPQQESAPAERTERVPDPTRRWTVPLNVKDQAPFGVVDPEGTVILLALHPGVAAHACRRAIFRARHKGLSEDYTVGPVPPHARVGFKVPQW